MSGSEVIADDERALAPGREAGPKRVLLVSGLKEQGLVGDGIGEGDAGLPGDGGHGGLPGLLLFRGAVFPRRQRARLDGPVGFVGSSREVLEADGHIFDDARGAVAAARETPRIGG
jgi:hypothetical protein